MLQDVVQKKVLKPVKQREVAQYLMGRHQVSERRATQLARFCLSSIRYQSCRDPLTALRQRMRELAQSRVRFGYRRLLVLLQREGWELGKKRFYRLSTSKRACRSDGSVRGDMRPPCTASSAGLRPRAMTSGVWASLPTSLPMVDGFVC
jgi:hypothetical protein